MLEVAAHLAELGFRRLDSSPGKDFQIDSLESRRTARLDHCRLPPATGMGGPTVTARKASKRSKKAGKTTVSRLVRKLSGIYPSPENDKIYRPVSEDDPGIVQLADSIKENGILEPLVITLDGWILSGHRRYVAARIAGLDSVPVRIEDFQRSDDSDKFIRRLREHNLQRDKSIDEKLREELISANPDEAYYALIEHRKESSRIVVGPMRIRTRSRSKISRRKQMMLDAVLRVIEELRDFLPIGERQIHYNLLRDPPFRNSVSELLYANDRKSSSDLSDLVTRARAESIISWDDICDETRPVVKWEVHNDCRSFLSKSIDGFMKNYWRDLMVSQPTHIEMLVEKNTVLSIVKKVAAKYTIPVTSGRGNSSKAPLWQMVKRFRASGKDKLTLLLLSDFDSDGISITDSVVGYMVHDFADYGITTETLHPVRMGLWKEQVHEMDSPPTALEPNLKSTNYKRFVEEYGTECWELEAITPEHLQRVVQQAIDSVIDQELFNAELDKEREDAVFLSATRKHLHQILLDSGVLKTPAANE